MALWVGAGAELKREQVVSTLVDPLEAQFVLLAAGASDVRGERRRTHPHAKIDSYAIGTGVGAAAT